MKSIKPGRGPSGMKFLNSIFSIVFGAIWTLIAIFIATGAMVAGGMLGIIAMIFPLFGVVFMINGIVHAMYRGRRGGRPRPALGEGRGTLGPARTVPASGARDKVLPLLRSQSPGGLPFLPQVWAGAAVLNRIKRASFPSEGRSFSFLHV